MEKKESSTGLYGKTFEVGSFVYRISPEVTKTYLTDQTKVALLEYLKESDEFHKLVCDITGVERKQKKVSPELEKLKEDYSHVCDRYKHEQQKSNDLLHRWREETASRLDAEKERDNVEKHHKHLIDEISSMLKEVKCSSVRGIVDSLKEERANGRLLAEENEMCRRENDKLKLNYDKVCKEKEKSEKAKYETKKKYNTDFEYLNKCNQNQAKTITNQMNDILSLRNELIEVRTELAEQKELAKKYMAKSEKLQSRLDKASKRYGELIKIISDKAIKSI